ncbi:MAG: ATP-binding protein [Pseudomonadota bacterium]|nr:ATP-binding protein [Pseudomonadota bacterium]
MKLRTQILAVLFLFGFTPLILALAINLPMVFDQVRFLYQKVYLQSLRADFRDLDQHLATRREMVRLLAKLPEPGLFKQSAEAADAGSIEAARVRYTDWINRLLADQTDIVEILFVDAEGNPEFWLDRDPLSHELEPVTELPERPDANYLESGLILPPGGVLPSPIMINVEASAHDPTRLMTLAMISPVFPTPELNYVTKPLGAVVIDVDIGGLARIYRNTYWVRAGGEYLRDSLRWGAGDDVFAHFPGLESIFQNRTMALWKGDESRQVIWIPLFATAEGEPLWVGRSVDTSPIDRIGREIALRVGLIMGALVIAIALIARGFAARLERVSRQLTNGLEQVLSENRPVTFSWKGAREIQSLGDALTRLASTHAENNEALKAHARELEESNRYKSEFLANVSHELRTPLNSILLLSKILSESRDPALSDEQARQARVIHTAGGDLIAMIDNILDLSRIEARKSVLRLAQVPLGALLEDLRNLFAPQFRVKGLELNIVLEPDAPQEVYGDVEKISQILRNFLANALKFTREGGVTATVSLNRNDPSGQRPLRISVSDTGIGIPEEKQGIIFEPFEQVDGSTRRRFGGTGLGLAISRELARLMNGVIELRSEEGKGSTFSLLLPLAIEREQAEDPGVEWIEEEAGAPSPEVPEVQNGTRFVESSLLVIEPDIDRLMRLVPMLEHWGFRVTAAADLEEAGEAVAGSDTFCAVLMDIMRGSGHDTTNAVRGLPGMGKTPMIVYGDAADTDVPTGGIGADARISDPFDQEQLLSALEKLIGAGHAENG